MTAAEPAGEALVVRVDQELCTGDGLCVQVAPDVFEFDVDGLAYVKGPDGELRTEPGATAPVPGGAAGDVLEAAKDCPGVCIFVSRAGGEFQAGHDAGR